MLARPTVLSAKCNIATGAGQEDDSAVQAVKGATELTAPL